MPFDALLSVPDDTAFFGELHADYFTFLKGRKGKKMIAVVSALLSHRRLIACESCLLFDPVSHSLLFHGSFPCRLIFLCDGSPGLLFFRNSSNRNEL